ncbi:hypothetical protein [Lactococcus formosensis]|uniref:Lipoprotein n=1 Tax=Lactococcus formosensis TaxID=1281486 RepID=A0A9Q8Y3Y0_9LACT|nr:hypothetical protein [Lactococcus formosensis]USJ21632.1 hypothetical protein LMK00_12060 [Lactococcus formosensis]
MKKSLLLFMLVTLGIVLSSCAESNNTSVINSSDNEPTISASSENSVSEDDLSTKIDESNKNLELLDYDYDWQAYRNKHGYGITDDMSSDDIEKKLQEGYSSGHLLTEDQYISNANLKNVGKTFVIYGTLLENSYLDDENISFDVHTTAKPATTLKSDEIRIYLNTNLTKDEVSKMDIESTYKITAKFKSAEIFEGYVLGLEFDNIKIEILN